MLPLNELLYSCCCCQQKDREEAVLRQQTKRIRMVHAKDGYGETDISKPFWNNARNASLTIDPKCEAPQVYYNTKYKDWLCFWNQFMAEVNGSGTAK